MIFISFLLLNYFLSICLANLHEAIDTYVVETDYGNIRGYSKLVLGKKLYIFSGIPYARPPIGRRRFRKPSPIEPWTGVLDGTKLPNTCVQEKYEFFPGFSGEEMWNPNTPISEDCLYLNIWVPEEVLLSPKLSPVLVWIYGGGYMTGTSTLEVYDADILSAESGLIVCSMQYRVGAFGFFYQGSKEAPGNMGLYDQAMALQWIKDNVKSFHGDGDQITLFGESAGAGSVSTHLISPVSRHIPKRAVLQSGAINAPWSNLKPEKSIEISNKLVTDCNCQRDTPRDTMRCMRTLPAKNISVIQWNSYWGILGFPSSPTVDGEFLPRDPWEMLKDGDFSHIELMMGTNQDEGTFFILYDFIDYFKKDNPSFLPRAAFLEIIDSIFGSQWPVSQLEKDAIIFQYTDWEHIDDGYLNQKMIGDVVGDFFFVCPCNYFAMQYAEHGNQVYYYYFNHRTSSNPWGDWMGVLHGDEIDYVFGNPLNQSRRYTEDEADLSRRIMKHYTHFAKYGNPVYNKSENWPLYNRNEPQYFIWNGNIRGTGEGPRASACAFWNEFMPMLRNENRTVTVRCARSESKVVTGGSSSQQPFILPVIFSFLFLF